jgi:hypothetical protein
MMEFSRPIRTRATRLQRTALRLAMILTALLISASAAQPAAAIDREGITRALLATVQVIVPDNEFEIFSLGSGTVMNDSGLILTNYHVVDGDRPNGLRNDDGMAAIAVAPADLRGESVLKYYGLVVKTHPELDLALIQIVATIDNPQAQLPSNLGLTPITLGNSDDLIISDEINMFGYPDIGSNTPTYTKGIVAGFLDEDRDGIYEWIKTDASLAHGNSGGLATDANGHFVGVPTQVAGDDAGSLGLVRTGNIALEFVRSYFPSSGGDGPSVTNVQFAEAINRRGRAINPGVRFVGGITDLYAVFDHAKFKNGAPFTYVWYRDGFESARDSFAWDSGADGTSWVSLYNDEGLADGFVEVELIYDGQSLYRGGVVIGEVNQRAPASQPVFGPITFAQDIQGGQPVNAGTVFSDLYEIYAFFDYSGMTNGAEWRTRWLVDGQEVLSSPAVWDAGESGGYYVSLSHDYGLPAADYMLELYIEDDLAQSGGFEVTETDQPAAQPINLIGVVSDEDNSRQLISGALIIFLQPGVTIDNWIDADFPDDMIYGSGTSNRRGRYQLDAKVMPGESYSVVVLHDDYRSITVDDFLIEPDSTDPYELEITMRRK